MTTDNQKKYEEAAKAYVESHSEPNGSWLNIPLKQKSGALFPAFLAGASFAEKEAETTIQFWKDQLEKVTAQRDQSNKFTTEALHENQQLKLAKEEAHNSAIDKCINAFKTNKGVLSFEELEKLKI